MRIVEINCQKVLQVRANGIWANAPTNKVTCAWCGQSWEDSHPDSPDATIWCGECNRAENPLWLKGA